MEMTRAEAKRHDLYNSLAELIGTDQANTLMAYLPTHESHDLVTKDDLAAMREEMRAGFDRLERRIDALGTRLDRIVLSLIAALLTMLVGFFAQAMF